MGWSSELRHRIRALFDRSGMERDLDDEFEFHLDMEARKYEAMGMTPADARRRARLEFGGVDRQRESARESWGISLFLDLRNDLRYALRQLGRSPAFAAIAVATLALGIGGTVSLASVVHGVLVRPLPVADEARLVTFWSPYNWQGAEFDFARERVEAFEGLAAFSNQASTLRTSSGTSMLLTTVASAELFDVLGTPPMLGRTFLPGEDRPGAERVVVLGHGLWQQEFGGRTDIVGERVTLDGAPTTVIGVMPEGFYFPSPEMRAFVPLQLDPASASYRGGWLVLLGRTRRDWTDERVAADLSRFAGQLGERFEYAERWDKSRNPVLTPLREYLLGDVRPAVLLLMGAVGLLLLMACANVAALLLTRSLDRTGEMAVRAALGAGRVRLARQVLTEAVVLGLMGGAAGLVLAWMLFDVMVASLPLQPGFADTLSMDWTTLVGALLLSGVTGGLISLAPIRGFLRGDLSGAGFGERRSGGQLQGAPRLQHALVISEVLLAVVLVTGAAVLIRTVGNLRSIDSGLDARGVLSVGLYLAEEETTGAERDRFFEAVVERVASLPGVSAAGLINRLPVRDGGYQGGVVPEGRPDLVGEQRVTAYYRTVSPGALEALGVVPAEGRLPGDRDRAGDVQVAVVNEAFADAFWPGDRVIGRRFETTFRGRAEWQVVGVIPNLAIQGIGGDPSPATYHPWPQGAGGASDGYLVVKSAGGSDPAAFAGAIRGIVREVEPRAAVADVTSLDDVLDQAMSEALRLRFFLTLFSALGLTLAVVGVYGVVSYTVDRRRAEFGIRMALGADALHLAARVVRVGMAPVVVGVAAGSLIAYLATRVLADVLQDVDAADPVALLLGSAVLLAAGVAAALVPAVRASRTEPGTALRIE